MRARSLPWGTLVLVGLNVLLAFWLVADPDLAFRMGFRPRAAAVWTALTSMFIHANLVHMLGNMVVLAAVGPKVEETSSAWRLALLYTASGLAGALVHWAMFRSVPDAATLIGASGAVAGCLGYASLRYLHSRVPLAPRLRVTIGTVALVWLALQGLGMLVRAGDPMTVGAATAYWVHIAGFLIGLGLAFAFRVPAEVDSEQGHRLISSMSERSPAATLRAAEHHLERFPEDLRALRVKATALHDLHEPEAERRVRARILDLCPEAEVPVALQDLADAGGLALVSSLRRLRLAAQLRDSSPTLARALLESLIAEPDHEARRPDAILELAVWIGQDEAALRDALFEELRTRYPFHSATELARRRGLLP